MPIDGLATYLRELASASPAPGGGAAAALTIAQGLALLAMACNLTIGKKKFAAVEEPVRALLLRISKMSPEALAEVDADAAAFGKVIDAYRLPAQTDAEKSVRQAAVAEASCQAAEPPLRLLVLAAEALPLADRLEQIGNPQVASDVRIARLLLVAGCHASQENVAINLQGLPPGSLFVSQLRERLTGYLAARLQHEDSLADDYPTTSEQRRAAAITRVRTFLASLALKPAPLWVVALGGGEHGNADRSRACADAALRAFAAAGVPVELIAETNWRAHASSPAELLASNTLKLVQRPLPAALAPLPVHNELGAAAPIADETDGADVLGPLLRYLACVLIARA